MELYERIRYLAEKKGISFAKLAKEIGIPQQTFHQWLKPGSQRNIWEHLPKLLEIFSDVRPAWLYMGELPVFWDDVPEKSTGRNEAPCVSEMRGKLRLHPGYHDDPLGRIEMLVNVRGSSALELQTVFGADYKELKPFVARYYNARQAWAAWRAAGSREEDVPDTELPRIPDEWLDHFWRHYGPSPHWILYGGGERDWAALLEPRPGMAETDRLRGELAALREEAERLRQELAAAHEKNAHLEVHEEEAQRLRDEAGQLRQELADAREKNVRLEVHEEEVQRLREETERLRQELAAAHARLGGRETQDEERTPPDMGGGSRAPLPPDANATPSGGE